MVHDIDRIRDIAYRLWVSEPEARRDRKTLIARAAAISARADDFGRAELHEYRILAWRSGTERRPWIDPQ
jgi:hypothetical protein